MRISKSYKIFTVCNTIFMILMCAVMIYPYLNQLAISFNTGTDTALGGITVFPRSFTLENYKIIFADDGVGRGAMISVTRTILSTVLSLMITYSGAYALTRKNLKGRNFVTKMYMVTMYFSAGTIPTYILYRYLGLMNNFWVYVLPYTFSFYNMVIIRSFLQEIPASLEEAALIDGANEIKIMFSIMLPLSVPVLATVALWIAVGQWNEYTSTLYFVTDKNLYTLQYLMVRMLKQNESLKQLAMDSAMGNNIEEMMQQPTTESTKAAMLIVTTVPILCVYPFLQKYFVKGVTLGAVKG